MQRPGPALLPLLLPLLLVVACSTPDPGGVRVLLADGGAPAFAADADAILADLEAWRGRPFLEDLRVEFVPADGVPDDKLNGWYESDTKRLVVVEGKNGALGRGVLLHEMFHALQDQHFDLAAHHAAVAEAGEDARRALRALVEGEAMLAVAEILDYDFERHAHLPDTGPVDAARFEKLFHYGSGLRFVRALRDAGGWGAVDAAYAAPPRTTAAIYHPQRYLAPPAAPALPQRPPRATGPGFPRGEFELRLFLARSEALRPRLDELAAHVIVERAWRTEGGLLWVVHFDDPAVLNEVFAEGDALDAPLVGALGVGALGEPGGLLTIRLAY